MNRRRLFQTFLGLAFAPARGVGSATRFVRCRGASSASSLSIQSEAFSSVFPANVFEGCFEDLRAEATDLIEGRHES